MRTRSRRAVAVVALVLGSASGAQSTTITVNSTADSLAIDGHCTLREAIIAANSDTAVDACAAGSGADVVMVPAGTYTLTLAGAGEDAAATGDLD
jgi:CSLREA domain-containing protein